MGTVYLALHPDVSFMPFFFFLLFFWFLLVGVVLIYVWLSVVVDRFTTNQLFHFCPAVFVPVLSYLSLDPALRFPSPPTLCALLVLAGGALIAVVVAVLFSSGRPLPCVQTDLTDRREEA